MRSAWVACFAAISAGCGDGARQPAEAPSVVVAASAPTTGDRAQPEPVHASPPPIATPAHLDSCVPRLRAGAWLASKADPAQAPYEEAMRLERSGDLPAARKAYFTIIQQEPSSAFVPLAYLAFGELFRAEAQGDPSKLPLARQAFTEVTKFPPPANQVYAYATLRLGQTYLQDDPAKALVSFKRVLDGARTYPDAPCAPLVGREAEHGLVDSYAEAGRADRAGDFFRASAPDRVTGLTVALAQRYAERGQIPEGVQVLRLELERGASPELCASARDFLSLPAVSQHSSALAATVRTRC